MARKVAKTQRKKRQVFLSGLASLREKNGLKVPATDRGRQHKVPGTDLDGTILGPSLGRVLVVCKVAKTQRKKRQECLSGLASLREKNGLKVPGTDRGVY